MDELRCEGREVVELVNGPNASVPTFGRPAPLRATMIDDARLRGGTEDRLGRPRSGAAQHPVVAFGAMGPRSPLARGLQGLASQEAAALRVDEEVDDRRGEGAGIAGRDDAGTAVDDRLGRPGAGRDHRGHATQRRLDDRDAVALDVAVRVFARSSRTGRRRRGIGTRPLGLAEDDVVGDAERFGPERRGDRLRMAGPTRTSARREPVRRRGVASDEQVLTLRWVTLPTVRRAVGRRGRVAPEPSTTLRVRPELGRRPPCSGSPRSAGQSTPRSARSAAEPADRDDLPGLVERPTGGPAATSVPSSVLRTTATNLGPFRRRANAQPTGIGRPWRARRRAGGRRVPVGAATADQGSTVEPPDRRFHTVTGRPALWARRVASST